MTNHSTFVVFGAGGGIGSAVCRRLAAAGTRLVMAGRSVEKLQSLTELPTETATLAADATVLSQVESAFALAAQKFARVDGVVNCAGSLLLKPAHLTSSEEWSQVMATNLTSSFNIVRTAARMMTAQEGGGAIVLLSSSAAEFGIANHEAIAAAKAGVTGLARAAAATYARSQVRVNCVAPGLTRTPLTATLTANAASLAASTAMHALGRVATPDDIASAIVWLLDPANSFVTGQVLAVDGGLSTLQPRFTAPTQPRS
jgi:3-oxoacyl-[acyl-carrier protein] reductase